VIFPEAQGKQKQKKKKRKNKKKKKKMATQKIPYLTGLRCC